MFLPDENNIEQNENEIAVVEENKQIVANDEMTFEQKKNALNALTQFKSIWEELKENVELKINVVTILQMPVEQTDRNTGEVRNATRCVFITDDNRSFATSSEAINETVNVIRAVFGKLDNFEQPLPCVFKKAYSNGGNQYINLSF